MNKAAAVAKIKEALVEAIHERVRDAYQRTQNIVPVVSGNLKRSGKEEDISNGAELKYEMEYSSFVERGMAEHTEYVSSFSRKDGTYVKGFYRRMPARQPRNFIRNSMKGAFEIFPSAFDSNLRDKFGRVSRK